MKATMPMIAATTIPAILTLPSFDIVTPIESRRFYALNTACGNAAILTFIPILDFRKMKKSPTV
jgi:hypothetical protein